MLQQAYSFLNNNRFLSLTCGTALLVLFYGLGDVALQSFNEARRALAAREMWVSGNWLLPHLNGELYITKPPFFYWLQAFTAQMFGHFNERIARLPSALAALSILLINYRLMRRFNRHAALFAVQILLMNASFVMLARRAEIEMTLAMLCFAAILAAIHYIYLAGSRRYIYLSYFLLALGVLTKGPVVLLFVTLPLIILYLIDKDTRVLDVLTSVLGWLLFIVIGGSWYFVVSTHLGFDVWHQVAQRDLMEKMTQSSSKPLLSYIGWIALDFLPFILMLLIMGRNALTQSARAIGRQPLIKALVVFALVPLVIFSLFSNKHAKYLIPIYPVIALVGAAVLTNAFQQLTVFKQRLLQILGVFIPLGFMLFYLLFEAQVFAYRFQVLPQIAQWAASLPKQKIAVYDDADERLYYYLKRPVEVLNKAQLLEYKNMRKNLLVMVEQNQSQEIENIADCKVKTFSPYLKKGKSLEVFGFANACDKVMSGLEK